LLDRLGKIKLAQIVLAAVTTGGFLVAIFGKETIGTYVGVVVSTILLVLNAYTKDYDLGELAQKHRQAASDLWLIREKYLSLITDLRMSDESVEEIRKRRDALLVDLHSVYSGAPSTTFKAYQQAQKALQKYEDMTFSDKEIDEFLPSALRKAV
jgi:general stress protein CsbA